VDVIATEKAPKAIGPYSQAIRAGGVVYCSGQIGLEPGGSKLVADGIDAETRQVLANLSAVLAAGGSAMSRVVKTTVYLKSMDDFHDMNGVYMQQFRGSKPARATVEVSQLPKGARVEIDAIALVKE
jgi:2-iminobutanoate/2-iminopropanoate deaminase